MLKNLFLSSLRGLYTSRNFRSTLDDFWATLNVNWNFLETFFYLWLHLIEYNCYVQKQPPEVIYCNSIKKEAQVFSCEFCEFSKNTFFTEHPRATASVRFKKILTLHLFEVSSSPNSPLLFVIVFWGETNRSSLSQMKFLPATLLKRDSNTGVFLGNLRNF